jgi:hypothetical protein
VHGALPTWGLSPGRHILFVRGQDNTGAWGPVSAAFVTMVASGHVQGTVSNAESAAPVAGAALSATGGPGPASTTTDAAGAYHLSVSPGEYTLTASAFGYISQTTTFSVTLDQVVTRSLALQPFPSGELTVLAYELGTGAPLSASVAIETAPVAPSANPTATVWLPVGTYTITVAAPNHATRRQIVTLTSGAHLTRTFRLPPPPPLLVMDDDLGQAYESYILSALDALGFPYAVRTVATQGVPSAAQLAPYRGVLWFTGDDRLNSLTFVEQSTLRTDLEEGGRLFLTGQNIGVDISGDPTHFYRDVLHATFERELTGTLPSVVGAGLYAGVAAPLYGAGGAGNQLSPDVIAPYDAAAQPIFTYAADGGGAGLAVESGAYRLIYLGYGLEGVSEAALRETILRDGLAWLEVGYPPARLALTLEPGQERLQRNVPMSYTLTILNDSLMAMSGGVVTVTLPPSVMVTGYADGATPVGDGVIRWDGLSLASEAAMSFWWTIQIPGAAAENIVTCTVEADWARMTAPAVVQAATPVTPAYNFFLTPAAQTNGGRPGAEVVHHLTLANTGDATEVFTLTKSSSYWPTVLDPMQVTVAPGASAPLTVTVTIPPEGDTLLLYAPDVVTVTAVLSSNPALMDGAVMTTVLWSRSVFLPVVVRW